LLLLLIEEEEEEEEEEEASPTLRSERSSSLEGWVARRLRAPSLGGDVGAGMGSAHQCLRRV